MKKKIPALPYIIAIFCISALYHWTNLAQSLANQIVKYIPLPLSIINLGIFIVLQIIPFLFLAKKVMLVAMPHDYCYIPVNTEEHFYEFVSLGLNTENLAEYTLLLENLGFEKLIDYHLEDEKITMIPGFARLFLHPQANCWAEVSQILSPYKSPMTMRCVFISIFTDDRSLTSFNTPIDRFLVAIAHLWRSPRHLWINHPNTDINELWQLHLEKTQSIVNDLRITLRNDLDTEYWISYGQEQARHNYQMLKRKNFLVIPLELFYSMINPPHKWLGDYRKIRPVNSIY